MLSNKIGGAKPWRSAVIILQALCSLCGIKLAGWTTIRYNDKLYNSSYIITAFKCRLQVTGPGITNMCAKIMAADKTTFDGRELIITQYSNVGQWRKIRAFSVSLLALPAWVKRPKYQISYKFVSNRCLIHVDASIFMIWDILQETCRLFPNVVVVWHQWVYFATLKNPGW